jgi:hypothetical protein
MSLDYKIKITLGYLFTQNLSIHSIKSHSKTLAASFLICTKYLDFIWKCKMANKNQSNFLT